jgi:hypothetical protein
VAELEGQLTVADHQPGLEPERTEIDPASVLSARLRARQLSEGAFVAGSDALVRVRTAIRLVQDCRQRIDGGPLSPAGTPAPGPAGRHENGGEAAAGTAPPTGPTPPAAAPAQPLIHDLFRALRAEIGDLARSAQGLGGAVDGLVRSAEHRAADGEIAPNDPRWTGATDLGLSALKCRALAVELEGGLQRLGAELRILSQPFWRRSPEVTDRPERNGSDRTLAAGLRRLEGQLEEVAEHLGRLTRDAEELSRELDRHPERG